MNQSPLRFFPRPAHRLLLAACLALPAGGACSSSDDTADVPITFDVQVSTLDGNAPDNAVILRCDHDAGRALSTLAVAVNISSVPADSFVLRPANACGESTRCGYVRVQGLSASGEELARVDTATTVGVLTLDIAQLPELSQIRVSLISGVDQTTLLNPDKTEVKSVVSPDFVTPSDCVDDATSMGGAGSGGAGNDAGGAGNDTGGDSGTMAGAGGQNPSPSLGGAGGDSPEPSVGGAPSAGAAALPDAGAGGA